MKENLHDIDKLFKDSIDGHEETPSSAVWSTLDKQLDKKKVIRVEKKYDYLKKVVAALLVLLTGMSLYALYNCNKTKETANESPASHKGFITRKNTGNPKAESSNSYLPTTNPNSTFIKEDKTQTGSQTAFNKKSFQASSSALPEKKDQSVITTKNLKKNKLRKDLMAHQTTQEEYISKAAITDADNEDDHQVLATNQKEKINTVIHRLFNQQKEISLLTRKTEAAQRLSTNIVNSSTWEQLSATNTLLAVNEKAMQQNLSNHFHQKPSISVTAFFSPDLSWKHLEMDRHENHEDDKHEIESREQNAKALTTGILIEYNKGNHWSLVSGISLSKSTTSIAAKTIYARYDQDGNVRYRYNCSAGYSFIPSQTGTAPAFGDSIKTYPSKNKLQYIGIPLAVKYSFLQGKMRTHTLIGAAANLLTRQTIETGVKTGSNNKSEVINNINGLKPVYFNVLIGAGIDYRLTHALVVSFAPTTRLAITSINQNAPVKSYPKTLGLSAGLKIEL